MINILLVDDHAIVRTGMCIVLRAVKDINVIGEASTGEEALSFVANHPEVDVVLMDIKMEGIGGLEATRRLLKIYPHLKIIIFSAYKNDPYPYHLINAGAKGYLVKDCPAPELVDAIHQVYKGETYIKGKIAEQLAFKAMGNTSPASPFPTLSSREMQIVLMLIDGYSIAKISAELHLSPKTVSTYRYRVFQKLNIKNNVDLIRLAMEHGVLDKPDQQTS